MSDSASIVQEPAVLASAEHPTGEENHELMTFVTLDALRTLIQDTGYRAETVMDGGVALLRSASNGLGFDIRPGNVFAENPERLADVVFVALFAVQGTFPSELLNLWNRTHRFGRLFIDRTIPEKEFLVLSFDASLLGGVAPAYLRHQLLIWDSLVQQLVPWLREEVSKIAATIDTRTTASSTQMPSAQPANA